VGVKGLAEVLSPMVQAKSLDGCTMLLCQHLCLKTFVCIEGFHFGVEDVGDSVPSNVICEGDEDWKKDIYNHQNPHMHPLSSSSKRRMGSSNQYKTTKN